MDKVQRVIFPSWCQCLRVTVGVLALLFDNRSASSLLTPTVLLWGPSPTWNNVWKKKAPAFNLPHMHLAPPLEVTPFEFCRDFQHQKTTFPAMSHGIVCVILCLPISEEHQLMTDRWTDGQTDTTS